MNGFTQKLLFALVFTWVAAPLAAQDGDWTVDRFFSAARNGDVEQVRQALEANIDVNSANSYGATALMYACDRGHKEVVELLLEKGADPNVKDNFYGFTPLFWANSKGKTEIVELLKSKGAKSNEPAKVSAFEPDPADLKKYVGQFRNERMKVKVVVDDDKLKMGFGETSPIPVQPVKQHEFALNGGSIKFAIDGDKTTAINIKFGPNNMKLIPEAEYKAKAAKAETEKERADWKPTADATKQADLQVSSKNWPSFRGNGARGVADGQNPPTEWDVEEGENVLWQTPLEGLGLSCPVIWDDKLFITSAVAEEADGTLKIGNYGDVGSVEEDYEFEFRVICLNKNSGEKLWEQTANTAKPAVKRHTKSSHANPTVATDGKHVIAFFGSEGLYCYDLDGKLNWKKDLGVLDSGWFYDAGYQWGFGASPIIFEDFVIVQCDIQEGSFIAAFRLSDGEQAWRTSRDEIPSWSSPTVHEFGDLPMLLTGGTKAARGYDARTGEEIWSLKDHSEIVVPTPFVAHNLIYLASGYSPIQPIYAVRPDAKGDISLDDNSTSNAYVEWSHKKGGPYMPSPIVYGDYLYCCANAGILTCYEATTGEQVYKKRLPGGGVSFTASPLAADGHLYFTAENGRVIVVEAGPDFEHVSTNPAGESILATPAISEGAIYLRTQDSVIAVGNPKN